MLQISDCWLVVSWGMLQQCNPRHWNETGGGNSPKKSGFCMFLLRMLQVFWRCWSCIDTDIDQGNQNWGRQICLVGILKPIDQWTAPKRCLGNTKETPQFWIHHFESHFVYDHGHGHILVRVHQSVSQGLDHWDLDAAGAFHPSAARPFFTRCARCAASCAAPEASFTRKERQREATAGRTNQEISINMS